MKLKDTYLCRQESLFDFILSQLNPVLAHNSPFFRVYIIIFFFLLRFGLPSFLFLSYFPNIFLWTLFLESTSQF
jgi:hypothetical protein